MRHIRALCATILLLQFSNPPVEAAPRSYAQESETYSVKTKVGPLRMPYTVSWNECAEKLKTALLSQCHDLADGYSNREWSCIGNTYGVIQWDYDFTAEGEPEACIANQRCRITCKDEN